MKILNNIKKYFKLKTDSEKIVFSKTSADNVLDKNTKYYVDEEIDALQRYCDCLSQFVTPKYYRIQNTTDLNLQTDFSIVLLGRFVVGTGLMYTRSEGAGLSTATLDLPLALPPKNTRAEFSQEIRVGTTNYNLNTRITKENPDKISFSVDGGTSTIPVGATIPLSFCFVLDNNVISE